MFRVIEGPLKGVEGYKLVRIKKDHKLYVSIKVMCCYDRIYSQAYLQKIE